jgi:hypothetical protein
MDSLGLLFGPPYHAFKNLQFKSFVIHATYYTYLIKTNAYGIF